MINLNAIRYANTGITIASQPSKSSSSSDCGGDTTTANNNNNIRAFLSDANRTYLLHSLIASKCRAQTLAAQCWGIGMMDMQRIQILAQITGIHTADELFTSSERLLKESRESLRILMDSVSQEISKQRDNSSGKPAHSTNTHTSTSNITETTDTNSTSSYSSCYSLLDIIQKTSPEMSRILIAMKAFLELLSAKQTQMWQKIGVKEEQNQDGNDNNDNNHNDNDNNDTAAPQQPHTEEQKGDEVKEADEADEEEDDAAPINEEQLAEVQNELQSLRGQISVKLCEIGAIIAELWYCKACVACSQRSFYYVDVNVTKQIYKLVHESTWTTIECMYELLQNEHDISLLLLLRLMKDAAKVAQFGCRIVQNRQFYWNARGERNEIHRKENKMMGLLGFNLKMFEYAQKIVIQFLGSTHSHTKNIKRLARTQE